MTTTRRAAAAATEKFARLGTSSLLRVGSDRQLPPWWRYSTSTSTSPSASAAGRFFASDGAAARDSRSAMISPLSSSSFKSFSSPAVAAAANDGVDTFFRGVLMPWNSQPSRSVIQRSVGRSLFSSSASESPPPPPPPPSPPPRSHWENPPDATNPDPVTLQEQWRYATRMYSKWYAHAWGTAILAGVSFFGLGWFVKGENPLQFGTSEKKDEVVLKPE